MAVDHISADGAPAAPRPASTVIVVRPGAGQGIEVLLVRRHDQVVFMAGAHVFPGGRVDAADQPSLAPSAAPSRFPDLTLIQDLTHRRAAIRELAEEANVFLSVEDLEPVSHWVTPAVEIRRYDTRFFLACMPDAQQAKPDERETTELAWLTPADALALCRAGTITLPPPTWTMLARLDRFPSVDAAVAWARTTPIVRVEPGIIKSGTVTMLTLPGDPLHPAPPGWEVPADTRFVFEEGRWLPAGTRTGQGGSGRLVVP